MPNLFVTFDFVLFESRMFYMRLSTILVFTERPMVVFDSMTKDVVFQSLLYKIIVLNSKMRSQSFRIFMDKSDIVVPFFIHKDFATGKVFGN